MLFWLSTIRGQPALIILFIIALIHYLMIMFGLSTKGGQPALKFLGGYNTVTAVINQLHQYMH
jgi:hypothetical protein